VYSTQSLQPTSNPNTSGSGTNINSDGSCIVGYQDNGQFTPFHAFRWTQATGPVDLGTLDPANNASRSSFATDTNQDCSVVVGFSDLTANGATQHAFRWTSGSMVDRPPSRTYGSSGDRCQ
jgi:probable HAF family extracellular repeat protein